MKNVRAALCLSLFLATCISCCQEKADDHVTPQTKSTEKTYDSNPYSFCEIDGFWNQFHSLQERIDAVQFEESELSLMNTKELFLSCLTNPLTCIYTAYNKELDAVNLLSDHLNVYKELEKRDDAAEVVTSVYSSLIIDPTQDRLVCKDDDNYCLSIIASEFFELYIASARIPNLFSFSNKQRLKDAAERILEYKTLHPRLFSRRSRNISRLILEASTCDELTRDKVFELFTESLNYNTPDTKVGQLMTPPTALPVYTTIYTKGGQAVLGEICPEVSEDTNYERDRELRALFPNAIFSGHSSATYNCHAYAWHMTDEFPATTCRIARSYADAFSEENLCKYWTDDYYTETPNESEAEKVYYRAGDHSAIRLNDGYYVSKWGQGPLMKHEPSDCPYFVSDMRYYHHPTGDTGSGGNDDVGDEIGGDNGDDEGGIIVPETIILSIDGPERIIVGETYTYTSSLMINTSDQEWICSNFRTGTTHVHLSSTTGRTTTLSVDAEGIYSIEVTYVQYGEVLGRGCLIIHASYNQ